MPCRKSILQQIDGNEKHLATKRAVRAISDSLPGRASTVATGGRSPLGRSARHTVSVSMRIDELSRQYPAELRRSGPSDEAVAAADLRGVSVTRTTHEPVPLARNSKCAFLGEPPSGRPVDPWTIHSLMLFMPGPDRDDMLAALRNVSPTPMIFPIRRADPRTGEVVTVSRLVRLDFADPENTALLPLEKAAASLGLFPWAAHLGLRVNRVDLVSDHLVSNPEDICDRIAGLRLPYSTSYRGPEHAGERWLTIYHNGGKTKTPGVRVAHYPRLESLLDAHPDAGPAAVRHARDRVRQEIRFRGPGLRRRLGGGSMTPDVVFSSFAVLVEFAERRLRPVFEAGILSRPPRNLAGEAALASVVECWPLPQSPKTGEDHYVGYAGVGDDVLEAGAQ